VARQEWPLVGRTGELHRLRRLLNDEASGGVVLVGPPGVGKSRLAGEAVAVAERAGCGVARVTGTRAASHLPFGAVAGLLPPVVPGEGTAQDLAELLRRAAAALTSRAGDGRLVLLVDDAHHLDDASATLIHHLVATRSALLVTTVISGAPVADALVALWKDGLVDRLEVAGLRAEAIEELLGTVLAGVVDPAAVAQITVRCQGNVLFLQELVTGALADGTLAEQGGMWRVVAPLSPSERLVELVEARLSGLSADERQVLEVVSFGEPMGHAEITALADPVLAEGLERGGFLVSERSERRLTFRLAHPLYGEVIRNRIPALRLRSLARRVAEAVEATGARRREDTLRVATWRLEGGGARPDLMLAAATAARWHFDFPLSERLARAAVDAGAGFEARLLHAQLASLGGRSADAEQELAVLAAAADDDHQRGLVAITRLDNFVFYWGRIDEGLRVAEAAEAAITDPVWRDEVTAHRSTVALAAQGPRAAVEAAEPLLERASGRTLVWACLVASYALSRLGRLEAALQTATRGEAARDAVTEPLEWYPSFHVFARCEALAHAGRIDEMQELAAAHHADGLANGSAEAQALFAWQLAKVVGDRGDVESAARHAREAAVGFATLGRPQFERECVVYLAQALALGGEADEAAEVLCRLGPSGGRAPALFTATVDLLVARAWAAQAAGDLAAARRLLEEAAELGEQTGDLIAATVALHGLGRLDRARDVERRLTSLCASIEGDLAPARARHVAALATGDAEALLAVSEDFGAMGAYLLAAEAAAAAASRWSERGTARLAAAARQRAEAWLERCPGAVTPTLATLGQRQRLSPSEREAALLAAAGRSNRQIAAELVISIRTVENRLQRVYEKLGLTGRGELSAALRRK